MVGGRRYYMPENGWDPDRIPLSEGWSPPETGERFQFVTVGRLVPYKGFDLILQATAESAELRRNAELIVIGDGPSRAEPRIPGVGTRPLLDRYVRGVD